jgi:glycerol-3-phosphate dehydrogenase
MEQKDVVIIGAGVVGSAVARELARYKLKVLVVDKRDDVGGDASKSNNSLIGDGADGIPGTLEARMLRCSQRMIYSVFDDLDVPYKRCGAIMPAISDVQFKTLQQIMDDAYDNDCFFNEFITAEEVLELEPAINPSVLGGIYKPQDGVVDPFLYVVAMAENAAENGVEYLLDAEVTGVGTENNRIANVKTTRGIVRTKVLVNCAGLFSDDIATFAGDCDFKVNPRRGEFLMLDKDTPVQVSHVISPIPTPVEGRGKVVLPTIHGNILIGPTAEEREDKEDHSNTVEGLQEVIESVLTMIPTLHVEDAIHIHCGLRANKTPEGYHIDWSKKTQGYFEISGVRSTGVTASQGIARLAVKRMVDAGYIPFEKKRDFIRYRRGIEKFDKASPEKKEELISKDARYGHIVCRCETITEAEIVQAIHRPVGARTIDAIKRRVRPGMGRCQGGFCGPRVIDIIARETGISTNEVRLNILGSEMLTGELR